jgi:hypothetical protein
MIKKFLNWIKGVFKPTRQEEEEKEVVELTAKQQKILRKHKGQ